MLPACAKRYNTHGVLALPRMKIVPQAKRSEPPPDELWMEEALRCAQRALESGEVPVGAVVVHARDRSLAGDGTATLAGSIPRHTPKSMALREAGAAVGNHRLGDCELFVTIEPCAMCAGAMIHARIRRLVYGAEDPKAGAVKSVMQVLNHQQLNHQHRGSQRSTGRAQRGSAANVLSKSPVAEVVPSKRNCCGTVSGEVREWLKRSASKADIP